MATNCTFEWTEENPATGVSQTASKVISMADAQTVNTTPTATGGWNTASVNADKVRMYKMAASDGVPPGAYEKVGDTTFRRVVQ